MTLSPRSPSSTPPAAHVPASASVSMSAAAIGDDPTAVDDPLSRLHRMSRTAGLGSGDYVAINVVAVLAVVFGLASALVIVDPMFLAIPIVGIAVAIFGMVQVKNSNGTQSGMLLGAIGLILSLGFFTYKVGGEVAATVRTEADRMQIEGLLNSLGQDLAKANAASMADAYSKFDSAFTSRVPEKQFDGEWAAMRGSPLFGPMASMESNGLMKFDIEQRTGDPIATTIAVVHLKTGDPRNTPRWSAVFRKQNDHWMIEDMPDLFPRPQRPQAK